jgi:hypothetical protein
MVSRTCDPETTMAKRRAAADDITLYDIDPVFQDKLLAWLTQKPKGIIVDIGATPEAFTITLDPGGTFLDESFEHVLSTSMGSRSKKKYIDPELESRIHGFLHAAKARLTFGANKDGVFNMTVSNPDSRGTASDEDFEFALVIAEEKFWENMPARPKVPIAAVPAPMISPEAREAMLEETLPPGMAQYFRPRPTLSLPARPSLPPQAPRAPGGFAGGWQPPVARPAPPRLAPPAPKPAPKPKPAPLKFPLTSPTVPVMTSLGQAPSFFGGSTPAPGQFISKNARRPPPPSSKPFDPSAPREHYAKSHHFAVNTGRYMVLFDGRPLKHSFVSEDAADTWIEDRVDEAMAGSRGDDDSMRTQEAFVRERYSVAAEHPEESRRFEVNYDLQENARPKSPRGMYRREVVESLHMAGVPEYVASSMVYGDHAEFVLAAFKNKDNPEVVAHHIVEQERAASRERGYGWGSYDKNAHPMAAGGGFHGVPRDRRAQHAASGAWRIHVAGGDIAPSRFMNYDEAAEEARRAYGPSGWTVEWHAAGG